MIGYLSLSRCTENLSGGATQRLKLVRHLGSQLNNITHIFLMNQLPDYIRLMFHKSGGLLLELRDKHNNVLVVEYNRDILALADHIIELGPKAGIQGGEIVFEGNRAVRYQEGTLAA